MRRSMRQTRSAAARSLGGIGLVAALLVGVGSGLFHVGQALAGPGPRCAEVTAAGLDLMPVSTARPVERMKRLQARTP